MDILCRQVGMFELTDGNLLQNFVFIFKLYKLENLNQQWLKENSLFIPHNFFSMSANLKWSFRFYFLSLFSWVCCFGRLISFVCICFTCIWNLDTIFIWLLNFEYYYICKLNEIKWEQCSDIYISFNILYKRTKETYINA